MKSSRQTSLKTAMILAAGFGTRMKNLTKHTPKPLLPLNDLCIIEIVLKKLAHQGIRHVIINLHYMAEKFRAKLGSGSKYGVEIIYSEEAALLGSGGGVANAERYFNGETIIAVNADVLCDVDIQALYRFHYSQGAIATMNVLLSQNNLDYGLVRFDDEANIKGFNVRKQERPQNLNTGIFTGHQILSPAARAYLQPVDQSIIRELYKKAIGEGQCIKAHPFTGKWIDVGTEDFYYQFREKIRCGSVNLNAFK